MPFGELPANSGAKSIDPNAAKEAARQQMQKEQLARKINMSAVNITPQGETAIGFTDLSSKPPVNYYLVVGNESGGWKVNSANYSAETAEIEKDGVVVELKLGQGLVQQTPTKAKAATPGKPTLTTIKKPVLRGTKPGSPPALAAKIKAGSSAANKQKQREAAQKSGADVRSYMQRLRERKIKESAALKQADEAKRKQLEKLARDVATKEIKKQTEAIVEEASLEKELALEEERLLREEEEKKEENEK